jgi:hypothetical protein
MWLIFRVQEYAEQETSVKAGSKQSQAGLTMALYPRRQNSSTSIFLSPVTFVQKDNLSLLVE